MTLMVDPKLLDEITVSYDVASDVAEKLKTFLSASNEISQYHYHENLCAKAGKSAKIPHCSV